MITDDVGNLAVYAKVIIWLAIYYCSLVFYTRSHKGNFTIAAPIWHMA